MFFAPQRGWTQAIDLRAGDILVLVNGEYVIVQKTQHEILEEPVKVYNFQVEDFHTYHVGEQGVLVHNECPVGTDVGGNLFLGKKITAGKNFKDHYIRHKGLLEGLLGKKYPKYKLSNNGSEFLSDLENLINNGTLEFKGLGTIKKGFDPMNIYKGGGLTLITKTDDEFVTLLKTGEGMDLGIEFIG